MCGQDASITLPVNLILLPKEYNSWKDSFRISFIQNIHGLKWNLLKPNLGGEIIHLEENQTISSKYECTSFPSLRKCP